MFEWSTFIGTQSTYPIFEIPLLVGNL